jgi:hypothetical protein
LKIGTKIVAVALTLMLTIAVSLVALPCFAIPEYETFARISLSPSTVGVNQTVLVIFFLTLPCPTARAGFDPQYNWNNFTVKVTKPSGKTETFGPYTSDASGGAFFTYTPTEVGVYRFDFTFPGQTVVGFDFLGLPYGPAYFKPSNASTTLTVQREPISGYETPPLPTGFWARPIYGENRGWYKIS